MAVQQLYAEAPNAVNDRRHRLGSVDGVRGMAIVMVVTGHLIGFAGLLGKSTVYSFLFQTPLHVLWDETGAVQVFFVLSGFVLQLGINAELSSATAWRFLVVRTFRLYPLYAVGLLFALLSRLTWGGHANLVAFNADLTIFWNQPIRWTDLLRHLVPLFPNAGTSNINAVLWSIFIEFKFSLLFPVLAACVALADVRATKLVLFLTGSFVYSWTSPPDSAGRFLFHFALGAAIAKLSPVWLGTGRRWWDVGGAAFAVWLLELRYSSYAPRLDQHHFDLLCAVASGLLIVCVVRSPLLHRAFSARLLVWLGRRTYGIYLFHFPILLLTLSWAMAWPGATRPAVWIIAAVSTVLASSALAALAYRWVELPCNSFGKRIARSGAAVPPFREPGRPMWS